jgi:hypothetical protein
MSRRFRVHIGATIIAAAAAAPTLAQQVATDPAQFRQPALFVLPKAPAETLKAHPERLYTVDVAVAADGTVSELLRVEPDDAEFRQNLDQALRYWLFYPAVNAATCTAEPSRGRVRVQYLGGGRPARAWLEFNPMGSVLATRPPRILSQPATPGYPWREERRGLEGHVWMLGAVRPDGSLSDAKVLVGVPATPGFISVATEHFNRMEFEPALAERRCVLVHYQFKFL